MLYDAYCIQIYHTHSLTLRIVHMECNHIWYVATHHSYSPFPMSSAIPMRIVRVKINACIWCTKDDGRRRARAKWQIITCWCLTSLAIWAFVPLSRMVTKWKFTFNHWRVLMISEFRFGHLQTASNVSSARISIHNKSSRPPFRWYYWNEHRTMSKTKTT